VGADTTTDGHYTIRLARTEEVALLPAIERAAGALFRSQGLEHLPADVRDVAELAPAQREGRLWVAVAASGGPVGFALATVLGTTPHLDELDVHPDHGRRGLGRRLVRAVIEWARARNAESLTLSTFRDIPWNAPFYARLGFRALEESALDGDQRALREREARYGLPIERRCVMRLDLTRRAQ
jgi:GNAT superfamily N-acetyltransferase